MDGISGRHTVVMIAVLVYIMLTSSLGKRPVSVTMGWPNSVPFLESTACDTLMA